MSELLPAAARSSTETVLARAPESPSDQDVLITGGAGFIGSRLAEALSVENRVTVLDDFSTGARANVNALDDDRVVEGDVTDSTQVAAAIAGHDLVIHAAAMMGVERTLDRPLETLLVNVDGTRTVLEAAVAADVDRVVVTSTSEVYGDAPDPPYEESDATAPKTDYAVAKLADERFTRAFCDTTGVDYTVLRYFNVYGPRQDPDSYVVPAFVEAAMRDRAVTVHGSGAQTRDFTFIDDALAVTLQALGPAGAGKTFNVGTGVETPVADLAETVVDRAGKGRVEHIEHPRPYMIKRRCADVSNARDVLGYQPRYDLVSGIEAVLEEVR